MGFIVWGGFGLLSLVLKYPAFSFYTGFLLSYMGALHVTIPIRRRDRILNFLA